MSTLPDSDIPSKPENDLAHEWFPHMGKQKPWWIKIVVVLVALVLVFGIYVARHSGYGIDMGNLPKFIQANFIDMTAITSISKFRSGEGHDFSGGGESCRSMKHYFNPNLTAEDIQYKTQHNGIPKQPDGVTDIAIYSPVDGTIVAITEERTPIGKQVSIVPDAAPQFTIRLFHIFLRSELQAGTRGIGGSHVKAGEKIGVIAQSQGTDISVQVGQMPWNETYVSYFDVMPDAIFKEFQNRGASTRGDFIISKEYRDANPMQCGTGNDKESFIYPAGYDYNADDVHLSGYVEPTKVPSNQTNTMGNDLQNLGTNTPSGGMSATPQATSSTTEPSPAI